MHREKDKVNKPSKNLLKLFSVAGAKFASVKAGICYKERYDLTMVSLASGTAVAGVFTKSLTSAAPVIWCQKILHKTVPGKPILILVNSGNANAFTGKKGKKALDLIIEAASESFATDSNNIFMASTGVIGEPLDDRKIIQKIPELISSLSSSNIEKSARAIMTTDTYPKGISKQLEISNQQIVITGIAKGSGMIAPDMATMLGFIFTNVSISSDVLQTLTSEITERTFNAITVDSDTSTSDTVLVAATGKAKMDEIKTIKDPRALAFGVELEVVMKQLALEIVKDGEGATKVIEYIVVGAETKAAAKKIGFTIANSPLVKTALAGEDPNWGRIVMAIGKSGERVDRDRLSIYFGDILVATKGSAAINYDELKVKEYMKNKNIMIRVELEIGEASFHVWGCDLTHDYISINMDYRS